MNAAQIFQRLSPGVAAQVFSHLQEADKPTYRMAIQTLAAQRKLRPQFVERKPRDERYQWLQGALSRPAADQIGANLLQMWLMGTQAAMLCDFLDALGIPHEENGGIDNLPAAPPAEKLHAAIDGLLAKYPAEAVAVYLHSFQAMDIAGWPVLGEILAGDARLQFAGPTSASAAPGTTPVSPASDFPDKAGVPPASSVPGNEGVPATSSVPRMAGVPPASSVPGNEGVPVTSSVPEMAGVPPASDFPGRAGVPPAVAGILPGTSGDV